MPDEIVPQPVSGQDVPAETPEPVATPQPEPGLSEAERQELHTLRTEVGALKGKAATLDRLAEALSPAKTPAQWTEMDTKVRSELERVYPEIKQLQLDNAQLKRAIVQIAQAAGSTADYALSEKTEKATDLTRQLMSKEGLDGKDDKAVYDMAEVLAGRIRRDSTLKTMWERGQVKGAIEKAWEGVQKTLVTPLRVQTKRAVVHSVLDAPKATPGGGAPSASQKVDKLDFKDTSRAGRAAVHNRAFDRFQELLADKD